MKLMGEKEMLENHEKILQEQVLPDIEALKGIASSHAERMEAYEKAQQEAKNQQITLANQQTSLSNDVQSVKNDVQGVSLTLKDIGQELKDQNKELFKHVLGINTEKVKSDGAIALAKMQQEGAISIAKLDTKGKIIVGFFGATWLVSVINLVADYLNK